MFRQLPAYPNFGKHCSNHLIFAPESSYGDLPYLEKLPHYNAHNLLARSLNPQCYDHNPGFLRFKEQSELDIEPVAEFTKEALEARSLLYRQIAERIWNPDDLLPGAQAVIETPEYQFHGSL